jgi:hypothetical protein
MAARKRHLVKGQCPQCACGDITFIPSETMREKYAGPPEEIEILCPSCGAKLKGELVVEEEEVKS